MAAILGLKSSLQEICQEAAQGEIVSPANLNSPSQVVIAGNKAAVERAMGLAKQRGALRAIALNVSAPFHCALMKPAADRLAADLDGVEFVHPAAPLVNNADARVASEPAALRDGLKRQVTAPVRWEESMRLLLSEGVEAFVEVGPGKVLSGLLRQINRQAESLRVDDLATLKEVTDRLGGTSNAGG